MLPSPIALTVLVGILVSGPVGTAGASTSGDDAATDCYLKQIVEASPETTVAELRMLCAETSTDSATAEPAGTENAAAQADLLAKKEAPVASFSQQIAAERQSLDRSYSLTPHQPNYLLAYSLRNNPNQPVVLEEQGRLDKQEALLQISVKFPLWRRMLGTDNDLLFGYTSKSWFQAYNSALSKPFRETNYEPEVFWRHYGGVRLPLGVHIAGWDLGYNHQSNGRSEPLSRSWDRLMGRMSLDVTPNLSLALRAWYRFPEDEGSDDNPDIHQYLGYGDVRAIWTPNRNTFTAMFRPGTEKNGFEFTWSYPITKHFRLYALYFNGYGESLIDYDQKVERIGFGFTINDYLQAAY
jgi:phospholipase A1